MVRLILGELRQGALESIVLDALAEAAHVSLESVRKAMLFAGNAADVAVSAFRGGEAELLAFTIKLFRPLRPMLAQSAKTAAEAFSRTAPAAVEYKLDGARIQLHREGDRVAIYSRYGNDLSEALPEIVELGRSFSARSLVLDGEVIALRADGRPQPFQVTMQRVGRKLDVAAARADLPLRAFFFDCLYVDGQVLVEQANSRALAGAVRRSPARGARALAVVAAVAEEAEAALRARTRFGQRGRRREEPRVQLRRRPARGWLGQSQTRADAGLGGAGGRVGQRTSQGLAQQPCTSARAIRRRAAS